MVSSAKRETALSLWFIDPAHSSVHFKVRHMAISWVRGEFRNLSGSLSWDPDDLDRSGVTIDIDAASVDTRDAQRDADLRSADFLDAQGSPDLHFQSTRVTRCTATSYLLSGDLTIRGVARPVQLDVREVSPIANDPWGNTRLAATAICKISRRDFGLSWNTALESSGLLVGDEIVINVDVEFVKLVTS